MEIETIDAETFERMLTKFETFATKMEQLYRQHSARDMGEWLDNQDVCLLLTISPRTLQTLRDNGTLAFSRISHKTYYKTEDVEKVLAVIEDKRQQPACNRGMAVQKARL
ncbi:MAG: helix-turn-helix domain-containing protein [Mangrovibacterium sp.]